jgi:hypothetical protein
MSKYTHESRMKEIIKKRGRTPCVPTARVRHLMLQRKSRAGVVYDVYKPVLVKISNE